MRLLIAAVATVLLASVPAPSAAAGIEIVGDDARDSYVGAGGLILPGSVDDATRREVASCPECRWRLTSPCVDSDLGNAFDGQQPCRSVTLRCPRGRLMRTWFDPGTGTWRDLGPICLGEQVHTVASLGREVREEVRRQLPPLMPASLPARGVVTQVPTIFASGQQLGPVTWTDTVAGHRVRVTATPRWVWEFGDGARMETDQSGVLAADGPIRHVYRRPGTALVTCRVVWTAAFALDGIGSFPVVEPVRQASEIAVPVGEGRAVLTP